jgi:hypothetical protein
MVVPYVVVIGKSVEILFGLAILLHASRASFLAQVREFPRNAEPSAKMSNQPRFPIPSKKPPRRIFSKTALLLPVLQFRYRYPPFK